MGRGREGDASALQLLRTRFADDVRLQVQSVLRDRAEADAVTADVLARLPASLRAPGHIELPFTTWIRLLARRAALDHLGRPAPFACSDQVPAGATKAPRKRRPADSPPT